MNCQVQQRILCREQVESKIQEISQTIKKDPYSYQNSSKYLQRSEHYKLNGEYQSAISDLSKSLYMEPTYQGYVQRGKAYASTEMFYYALMDFQQAQKIYRQEKKILQSRQDKYSTKKQQRTFQNENKLITGQQHSKQKAQKRTTIKQNRTLKQQAQQFLQKSTVIINLPHIKKIVKDHEKSHQYMPPKFNQQFKDLMKKLIQQKVNEQMLSYLQQQKQKNQNYERLLQLAKKQQQKIRQLQTNIQMLGKDYEKLFYKQMQQSTMIEANKQKCIVYYTTVTYQMQKYYLCAKVLSQFDEKISFQDYQRNKDKMIEQQKEKYKTQNTGYTKQIIEKVFKFFQKNQSKMQRVGEIMKQIPYIGSVLKIIKSSMKVFGWLQQVKTQSQCENILGVRSTLSSFNKLSSKVAYQMVKYFKFNISAQNKIECESQGIKKQCEPEVYKKSYWDKIAKLYNSFRRYQAATVFNHIKPLQKNYVKQMANVHTSILMAGVAYGVFKLPNEYQIQSNFWQTSLFQKITQIQIQLLKQQEQSQILKQIQQTQQQKKSQQKLNEKQRACNIF